MKKLFLGLMAALMLSICIASAGFDEFGYNTKAGNFVGTCISWGI